MVQELSRAYWKGLKNKDGKPYGEHRKGTHHKGKHLKNR